MNNNSTKYLDDAVLDAAGIITKEVIDSFKSYCGLFSLVYCIYNTKNNKYC